MKATAGYMEGYSNWLKDIWACALALCLRAVLILTMVGASSTFPFASYVLWRSMWRIMILMTAARLAQALILCCIPLTKVRANQEADSTRKSGHEDSNDGEAADGCLVEGT